MGESRVGRAHACLICARSGDGRLHEGSVGGNVFEDRHWYAYHAPVQSASLGQLFLVSKRHFLDAGEMTTAEAADYGMALRALTAALKQVVGAERVYVQITGEGIPHFHTWLVPRPPDAPVRGLALLAAPRACSEADARAVADRPRANLGTPDR